MKVTRTVQTLPDMMAGRPGRRRVVNVKKKPDDTTTSPPTVPALEPAARRRKPILPIGDLTDGDR